MPVRTFPGPSHIWPSNMTEDGDPSTGLAFSSAMIPETVADMIRSDVGNREATTHLICRKRSVRESSGRCERSVSSLLSVACADKAVQQEAVAHAGWSEKPRERS